MNEKIQLMKKSHTPGKLFKMTSTRHLFSFFRHSTAQDVCYNQIDIDTAEDYYPSGLVTTSYRRENSLEQNYLYNGKELQDELNLGWLDYGARMYMPEIGRWGVVDPLVEKYYYISPYAYCLDNPILFIDPDGMKVDLSNLDKDEKKKYRREIRELKESKTFRREYNHLRRRNDITVTIGSMNSGTGFAISSKQDRKSHVSINFNYEQKEYSSEELKQMEEFNKTIGGIYPDNLSLTDIVGEEIIHAMILVNLMDSNEEPARLDQEFEAKSVRGIVKSEAGLPTATRPDEKFAEEAGVRYFNQGSINNYSNDMESWRNIENNPYKNFISNNSTPKLLQRIVSKKQKRGK